MHGDHYNLLGVKVSVLSLETAYKRIVTAASKSQSGYVCVIGVHGVSEARRDPIFRTILNRSYLNTPDGMPLVWLGRHHGYKSITRVYGPDLMLKICDRGRATKLRHYFYGGTLGVADLLAEKLCARFSGLEIVGTYTPPFHALTEKEFAELQADVAAKSPDIIWVGLGTPKQERFMAENWSKLETGLMIGVGAAFDFHSGTKKQAPRWMQRSGLEWLFRLAMEPRRLAYRYLVYNPLFVLRTIAQLCGLKRYPLDSSDS